MKLVNKTFSFRGLENVLQEWKLVKLPQNDVLSIELCGIKLVN